MSGFTQEEKKKMCKDALSGRMGSGAGDKGDVDVGCGMGCSYDDDGGKRRAIMTTGA